MIKVFLFLLGGAIVAGGIFIATQRGPIEGSVAENATASPGASLTSTPVTAKPTASTKTSPTPKSQPSVAPTNQSSPRAQTSATIGSIMSTGKDYRCDAVTYNGSFQIYYITRNAVRSEGGVSYAYGISINTPTDSYVWDSNNSEYVGHFTGGHAGSSYQALLGMPAGTCVQQSLSSSLFIPPKQ